MSSPEHRIARLERMNRVLFVLLIVPWAWVLLGALADEKLKDNVIARRFTLVDEKGRERAALMSANAGDIAAALVLFDEKQRVRGAFTVDGAEPSLKLFDAAGKVRLSIGCEADLPSIGLFDDAMRLRGWFALLNGNPQLALFDAEKKERMTLACRSNGPTLAMKTADLKSGLAAGVIDDDPSILVGSSQDPRGTASHWSPAGLMWFDSKHKMRLVLGLGDSLDKPGISILNAAEKDVWCAPPR